MYYKVKSKNIVDPETILTIVPDVNCSYRIIRPLRIDNFIIETRIELSECEEEISADNPIVLSHLEWWLLHPEDEQLWVEQ